VKPLWNKGSRAVAQGFEPWEACTSHAFEAYLRMAVAARSPVLLDIREQLIPRLAASAPPRWLPRWLPRRDRQQASRTGSAIALADPTQCAFLSDGDGRSTAALARLVVEPHNITSPRTRAATSSAGTAPKPYEASRGYRAGGCCSA
jgi:hypothetical protein